MLSALKLPVTCAVQYDDWKVIDAIIDDEEWPLCHWLVWHVIRYSTVFSFCRAVREAVVLNRDSSFWYIPGLLNHSLIWSTSIGSRKYVRDTVKKQWSWYYWHLCRRRNSIFCSGCMQWSIHYRDTILILAVYCSQYYCRVIWSILWPHCSVPVPLVKQQECVVTAVQWAVIVWRLLRRNLSNDLPSLCMPLYSDSGDWQSDPIDKCEMMMCLDMWLLIEMQRK